MVVNSFAVLFLKFSILDLTHPHGVARTVLILQPAKLDYSYTDIHHPIFVCTYFFSVYISCQRKEAKERHRLN